MKRLVFASLFCCACLATTFTSRHAAVQTPAATGGTTFTESFDSPQYGILQTSDVIDGTDYWHYGINLLDGTLQ